MIFASSRFTRAARSAAVASSTRIFKSGSLAFRTLVAFAFVALSCSVVASFSSVTCFDSAISKRFNSAADVSETVRAAPAFDRASTATDVAPVAFSVATVTASSRAFAVASDEGVFNIRFALFKKIQGCQQGLPNKIPRLLRPPSSVQTTDRLTSVVPAFLLGWYTHHTSSQTL